MEVDKKIKFHRVLGVEYTTRVKRFSNTEYIVKSYFIISMSLFGLFFGYSKKIYSHFYSEKTVVTMVSVSRESDSHETPGQVPAPVRIISIVVWQSVLPLLLSLCVRPFQTFFFKKIKLRIQYLRCTREGKVHPLENTSNKYIFLIY